VYVFSHPPLKEAAPAYALMIEQYARIWTVYSKNSAAEVWTVF
jgi:hypothetical protein